MALVLADRVLETTTTAGSDTITLVGAEPGYQSFSAVGDGNQTYYTITADTDWEVGIGTYTASGTTLSRDTVLSSSAGGAKVTFPAGIKKVFVTYPAERSVYENAAGSLVLSQIDVTTLTATSATITTLTATSASVTNLTLTSLVLSNLSIASANITTLTSTNATAASLTVSTGNLTFSGTAQRITGDFSNATLANRVAFRDATTNNQTSVGAIPNGTSAVSSFVAFGGSDPGNCARGSLRVDGALEVQIRSDIAGTGTYLPMTFYTGGSERMRLDTSGNLGIGTTSPAVNLNVARSADGIAARFQRSSGGGLVDIETYNAIGGIGTADNIPFRLNTNNTERLRIDTSGNVGIGTALPDGKLDIATGGSGDVVAGLGGSFPAFTYRNGSGSWFHAGKSPSSDYFYIGYGATPTANISMVVNNSGNVGIGTESPSYKLSVSGTIQSSTGGFRFPDGTTQTTAASAGLPSVVVTASTSISAVAGNHYVLTAATTATVTLPASPTISDTIYVTVANNLTTNVIARNGKNIQGLAEDMTLNAPYASAQLRFTNNATEGWILA